MIGWSGRRKTLTILAFIAPTLLGITVFSIYPLLLNVFISLTDRGKFHPNPDCSNSLWNIVEPTCWLGEPPRGLAEPFGFQTPIFENYVDLLGGLFTRESLLALLFLAVALLPILAAWYVNRRFSRRSNFPVSSGVVWLLGLAGTMLLGWLINVPDQYQMLLESGDFIMVNARTILYVMICIPLFFVVGLIMALILNNDFLRGKTFFRVILIVPWAASNVSIMMTLVWQFFFRQQGTINQILSAVLTSYEGPAFLNRTLWAWFAVVLVNLYYTYPFFMVTLLGGLQSIPLELYEAAEVDGATWWKQLTNITLPLLRPVALPIVVLSSLTTYKVDAVVWALTQGGPTAGAGKPGGTEFVMVHAYKQIFQTQAFGRMGAFAVILFIGLFAATLYSLRLTRITEGAYE
ncbi:MAG: sugar ABC transporter permease [Anaerolineae bacterium]|jgi:arabinogalactan oligomer/maltooligosaccharide transport system permease protein